MSGIKRKIEDKDPDYKDIMMGRQNKQHKVIEHSAREATVQKIEVIIKEQFAVEMKNKEHEIEIIDQRLNEARRMMDKLRACIVANYYVSAGQPKVNEGPKSYDPTVFNHPVIKKFLESPSRSSSPGNQRSETPSANQSETDSVTHQTDSFLDKESDQEHQTTGNEDSQSNKSEKRPGRNTGQVQKLSTRKKEIEQRCTYLTINEDPSRLYIKKTIVVGNVSKYIPPDKREENDQSTHKWMVYVRGSRKEPTIDHFVKKVWFFLHPSYKPNDLVEVSEPPFHLTRRGWGEFPVRIQIHFKDLRNKRIDIIHQLKLDRTYTGLQTLGAETVVDVELHRDSLGEDYVPTALPSSASTALLLSSSSSSSSSSCIKMEVLVKSEAVGYPSHVVPSLLERTPTRPVVTQKLTFGSHGNSAFQPITASCKIVPQGQLSPSPTDSPGKSFQPITMSCKIVSGSPISTPCHSPLPRTPTSTPVHMKQGSSISVISNPYIIVDKPGQVIGMATSNTGSPTAKQSGIAQLSQGTRSPIPKIHGSSFIATAVKQEDALFAAMPPLCPIGSHAKVQSPKPVTGGLGAFTKVIIKQEPSEAAPQQTGVTSVNAQQAVQQFVTMKGGQMIAVSPQKQASATGATTPTKVQQPRGVVGIPVGSTLQPLVKQSVALSSGQIIVAKPGSGVARSAGQKQMLAQGVAKAVVSGTSGTMVGQPAQAITKAQGSSAIQKSGTQGSVMATLQLPATNLANLANLPPGTKLYLTTNSKNPSGKGKLLLIPQGAILRAANPASKFQIWPKRPFCISILIFQGTFLVGQPVPQASVKQSAAGSIVPSVSLQGSSSTATPQQPVRVSASQKAVLTQVVPGGQVPSVHSVAAHSQSFDGAAKSLSAASPLSQPGTTTLRVSGGVITAANTPMSVTGTVGPAPSTTVQVIIIIILVFQGSCSFSLRFLIIICFSLGMLKIQSNQSSSSTQQAMLTIPAHQLKQLGVNTPVGGVQTLLVPVQAVTKGKPTWGQGSEDSHPFTATSLEQYYSWNIGKRRASEWQRAVVVRKMLQEVVETCPRFSSIEVMKTKQIMWWCRQRAYTPPDPETTMSEENSIEDILTQIDNEPEFPCSYSSADELCHRLTEVENILKTEPESEEELDIVGVMELTKVKVKKEQEEEDEEVKFYMGMMPAMEFARDTAQQVRVKSWCTVINTCSQEDATEQFISEILRESLGIAYQGTPQNRTPKELSVTNIHQAICNIPGCDFLTNKYMGILMEQQPLEQER
uniref:YEATS domain-containing protein 2 n=1 Tax=Callorhinchus milii TaxID=7868 RepID=A0A4W3I899_CALMI